MRPFCLRFCLCVLLGKDLVASAEHVTGPLNGKVRLPCTYSDATTTMCWGQGECPSSKCSREIIWTDGHNVTWRKSDRYQLLGDISQGDVSLTIIGATKEDEGTYCCRVEIPGWFNDQINYITVTIYEATPNPPGDTNQSFHTSHATEPKSPNLTPTATSTDLVPFTVEQVSQQNDGIEDPAAAVSSLHHIIAAGVIIIILISLAALLYSYRHCKRKNKDPLRSVLDLINRPLSPTIISLEGLERKPVQTEPNIYTID
ncbi:hepatitis A virus cellular receptor [Pristimantis euphronides]